MKYNISIICLLIFTSIAFVNCSTNETFSTDITNTNPKVSVDDNENQENVLTILLTHYDGKKKYEIVLDNSKNLSLSEAYQGHNITNKTTTQSHNFKLSDSEYSKIVEKANELNDDYTPKDPTAATNGWYIEINHNNRHWKSHLFKREYSKSIYSLVDEIVDITGIEL